MTATRFAELTGVSRERLRTWERRHGFPLPQRSAGGPRRYALSDAPGVIAVREAAATGVPIEHAIRQARQRNTGVQEIPGEELAASLAPSLPLPLAVLSGPEPLRFEYVNEAARRAGDHVAPGKLLLDAAPELAGSTLERGLVRLFSTADGSFEAEHPPWSGARHGMERTVGFRLPRQSGEPPLCAILSIDASRERQGREELARLRDEAATASDQAQRRGDDLRIAATISAKLKSDDGPGVIRAATGALAERLGAVDAGVALYMAGELVLGSSAGGRLGPVMVLVAGYEQLGSVIHADGPIWLDERVGGAFGAPRGSRCLAAPVIVGGETVGVVLLLYEAEREIDSDAKRLIEIMVAPIGFALLRDRFLEGSRTAS